LNNKKARVDKNGDVGGDGTLANGIAGANLPAGAAVAQGGAAEGRSFIRNAGVDMPLSIQQLVEVHNQTGEIGPRIEAMFPPGLRSLGPPGNLMSTVAVLCAMLQDKTLSSLPQLVQAEVMKAQLGQDYELLMELGKVTNVDNEAAKFVEELTTLLQNGGTGLRSGGGGGGGMVGGGGLGMAAVEAPKPTVPGAAAAGAGDVKQQGGGVIGVGGGGGGKLSPVLLGQTGSVPWEEAEDLEDLLPPPLTVAPPAAAAVDAGAVRGGVGRGGNAVSSGVKDVAMAEALGAVGEVGGPVNGGAPRREGGSMANAQRGRDGVGAGPSAAVGAGAIRQPPPPPPRQQQQQQQQLQLQPPQVAGNLQGWWRPQRPEEGELGGADRGGVIYLR
jgi:hypothetical protein